MISNNITKNIIISRKYHKNDMWGRNLLYHLSNNLNINVEMVRYPLPSIPIYRGNRNFTPFIYDDIIFIIDDWDHASPTCFLLNNPDIPKFYLNNNTCILKIQYCNSEINNYNEIYKQTNIKILPFTMFANRSFDLENFKWDVNHKHKFNFIFTGKPWRNRLSWINFAQTNKEKLLCGMDFSNGAGDSNINSSNTSFYDILKDTRWGVILKGKGCGAKNRREVEFSSLGMPLALNYIPNYPFSFIPNEDFILLESPEDLLKLKDIDPAPFAERSSIIYNEYFSPSNGVLNSLNLVHKMAKDIFTNNNIDYSYIRPDPDIITIPAKDGYHFGQLKKGDSISITYKSGLWRSWGRSGRSGVCPDNTNGRGGDRAKLAIFHKNNFQNKLIQIVPENTSTEPFIFTSQSDDLDLHLGICDRGNNPRGQTQYLVKLLHQSDQPA